MWKCWVLIGFVVGCAGADPSSATPDVLLSTPGPAPARSPAPNVVPEAPTAALVSGIAIAATVYAGEASIVLSGVAEGADVAVLRADPEGTFGPRIGSGAVAASRVTIGRVLEAGERIVVVRDGAGEPLDYSPVVGVVGDLVQPGAIVTYRGMCDASGALMLDDGRFVVADDETNVLRAYSMEGGDPVVGPSLSREAGATPKDGDFRELDLEGAARIGDVTWWIGSHGNNKRGKARRGRHRLLATSTTVGPEGLQVVVRGRYDGLAGALARLAAVEARFGGVSLDDPGVAPKAAGGTNIEGLAATPEGHLLVGFRNPISARGTALVVRIGNPDALVDPLGKTAPEIIEVAHLDLGGLGIRSLEWMPGRGQVFVLAGPPASGGPFRLYRWSGGADDAPIELPVLGSMPSDFTPEALFGTPDGRTHLLSDDGAIDVDGAPCKEAPLASRRFRGAGR